jgi:hypothetical protein
MRREAAEKPTRSAFVVALAPVKPQKRFPNFRQAPPKLEISAASV